MPMMRKTTSLRSIRKDHPVLTRLLSEDEDIIKIIRSFLTRLLSEDEDIVHGNIYLASKGRRIFF